MEYTTSINIEPTSSDIFISNNLMNINNLDEIESHYSEIFTKVNVEETIYIFNGSMFKKEDNCNLFLKYLMNVVEYYYDVNKEITIIMDLENINTKALNIDFILKFVKKFKKKYENNMKLRKFYILHCPSSLKNIFKFIKPFLHTDTINKINLISKKKSLNIQYYYYN
tara:strand:- start:82 stop:585 length:504 start_codon:yes stop_codon:yes gene_type:complete